MNYTTVDSVYNPGQLTKTELIERFVVRHKLFNKIYRSIKEADMKEPEQHLLIVGQRGMGKTTLLLRLAYEIEEDSDLNTWLMPIVLTEEQYSIRTLYNLWEEIAKYLADSNPIFEDLFTRMDALYTKPADDEVYEQKIFKLLTESLKANGKKIVLLLDNVQDFLKKMSKQETQRLREVLSHSPYIRLIAAAPVTVEAIYDYKHPLYEHFKTYHLKGLDLEQTFEVLKMLGQHYQQENFDKILSNKRGHIQALRLISGGVIRTIVLLFEFFTDNQNDDVFKNLERILDRVTGLYKDRTDELPKNLQAIIHTIAMNWDAISTKEIAAQTRLESKVISAQLKQLAKNDWINVIPTNTKNHLYQLNERFYNIWYLMRYGRQKDEQRVIWLVKFYKSWFSKDELKDRIDSFLYHYDEYMIADQNAKFLFHTFNHPELEMQDYLSELAPDLYERWNVDFTQNNYSKKAQEYYEIAQDYFRDRNMEMAIQYHDKAAKGGVSASFMQIAWIYEHQLKDFDKAEEYYLKAINKEYFKAYLPLAWFYNNKLKDWNKAEEYYHKAIDKGYFEAYLQLAWICNNKLNDFNKAEEYLLKAIDKGYFEAYLQIAWFYENKLNDFNKAEEYLLKTVNENIFRAWQTLGGFYQKKLQNYEKAKAVYLSASKKGKKGAKTYLAWLLFDYVKDSEEALSSAEQAFQETNSKFFSKDACTLANMQLWNHLFDEAADTANLFLYDEVFLDEHTDRVSQFLVFAMAKEQYQLVYEYFSGGRGLSVFSIERFKPIWFALMYFMREQYPNEYLKMGAEFKETVDEIIQLVEEMRVKYALEGEASEA